MRREFPDAPVVGVGAVVLDENRVVLVRRGQEPLQGEWSIPGGALELGETLEAGIRREVAEETGLSVSPVRILEIVEKIVLAEDSQRVRYHYVLVDFLCRVDGGEMRCASDAVDARWVAHEDLCADGVYRLATATAAVIEKGFATGAASRPPQDGIAS